MIRWRDRGPGLPLFAQITGLLLISILAVQAISIIVVVASPPPRPTFYALADVTAVLRGGPARVSTTPRRADVPPLAPHTADPARPQLPARHSSTGAPPPEVADRRSTTDAQLPEVADRRGTTGAPPLESAARLKVTIEPQPPEDRFEDRWEQMLRAQLAQSLDVPSARVRVVLWRGVKSSSLPFITLAPASSRRASLATLPRSGTLDRPALLIAPFTVALQDDAGVWHTVSQRNDARSDAWRRRLILWLTASTAVAVALGYIFARRLTAPLRSFADAAERFGRNTNAPALAVDGPAEIAVAARAFNDMQEKLRRHVEGRTQMIGAIAHDLRTPLTRLAFRIESAPDELRDKASADIAEMEAMIAAVLAFVREGSRTTRARLELSSLVESVAADIAETGASVAVETSDPVVVEADPTGMRRLVSNLVVNAVKYGEHASARVYTQENTAIIEVDDAGPGLPSAELERVFEPFYRVEQSRSRDTGGVGLGLAVVRMIAEAHGGTVELCNLPGRGLRAKVSLPL